MEHAYDARGNRLPGARLPKMPWAEPEKRLRMSLRSAIELIGEPGDTWTVYAMAPAGDVACVGSSSMRVTAAMLMLEMGRAILSQRRTEAGMEYLFKRRVEIRGLPAEVMASLEG